MLRGRRRLLCLIPLLLGCPAAPPDAAVPLLDGQHAPEVLTESASLDTPPSTSGNRFVRGWRGWRRRGRGNAVWLLPEGERSVIEAVFLDGRERRLTVLHDIFEADPGATVGIRVAGRDLPAQPLTRPLEVPLPPDLPLGRVPIELDFGAAKVAVQAAGFGHAWRPGRVRFEADGIVQSSYSAVDLVRRLAAPARLVGRFEPPADPHPEQRFAVLVETVDGDPATAFEWRPGFLARLLGTRPLGVELPAGLVRIRLLAQGLGRAGRWRGLALEGAPRAPEVEAVEPPAPPRLIVLYVLDALRADVLGHLGGDPAASPVIDRLAAEGVTFAHYYSTTPETASSTKVLLAGVPMLTTGHAGLPSGVETLGELFGAAGYRTGVISGNETASLYGATRGFEHQDRSVLIDADATGPNLNAERVHAAALSWLDGLAEGERALVYLHTVHPHTPYAPPEPFRGRFTAGIESRIDGSSRTVLDIKHGRRAAGPADRERLRALYMAGLAYNDYEIGQLVEELGRRFEPGEVLLVITSDHGEELFDHGGVLHGFTLYEEQLHIPLVLWWPGRLEPGRVDALADNLDLNATLRALVGEPPAGGRSLWPEILARSSSAPPDHVRFAAAASVEGGIFMAATRSTKLVLAPRVGVAWGMGAGAGRSRDPEYVFDLRADPGETRNLAGSTSLEVAWLRARLGAWIERGMRLEAGGEPVELDAEARARLEALGYLD